MSDSIVEVGSLGVTKSELDFDEVWSEDEDGISNTAGPSRPSRLIDGLVGTRDFEAELEKARAEVGALRSLLQRSLNEEDEGSAVNGDIKGKGKVRDDDSHYFDSYAENGQFACAI